MLCKTCGRQITNRNQIFCSFKCRTIRKTILCPVCQKETNNPKYCSSSCAIIARNQVYYSTKPLKNYYCVKCQGLIGTGWRNCRNKFCQDCNKIHNKNNVDWSKVTLEDLFLKLTTHQVHARIRALSRDTFKRSKQELRCKVCDYSYHVEICHIKSISSFDRKTSVAEVNDLKNLVVLCRNCHWELDHGILQINIT